MNMLNGTSNIPANANTTVMPLKTTARVAVPPARLMASIRSEPLALFFTVAGHYEQRVVNAHCQSDHGDDIADEERHFEGLSDQGGGPQRHHDGKSS